MATNFPTSVDVLTNPVSNDSLNSPSHSAQHANANDAIEAVEDYLLNGAGRSGLVLIKSQVVGSGVSSVSVTSAFSSTYDNYKILYCDGVASATPDLNLSFNGITTGYYVSIRYSTFSGTTPLAASNANGSSFLYIGSGGASTNYFNVEVNNPFNAKLKTVSGFLNNMLAGGATGETTGFNASTASATGFTITPSAGTLTGGTVYVYGYKKA